MEYNPRSGLRLVLSLNPKWKLKKCWQYLRSSLGITRRGTSQRVDKTSASCGRSQSDLDLENDCDWERPRCRRLRRQTWKWLRLQISGLQLLGHTPWQVLVGALVCIVITCFSCQGNMGSAWCLIYNRKNIALMDPFLFPRALLICVLVYVMSLRVYVGVTVRHLQRGDAARSSILWFHGFSFSF